MRNSKIKTMSEDEYIARKEKSIEGCLYLAEQLNRPDSGRDSYETQVEKLKAMGCNYTTSQVVDMARFEMKHKGLEDTDIDSSMGFVTFGESALKRYMHSYEDSCDVASKAFSVDGLKPSMYEHLRRITGDSSYTKGQFVKKGFKSISKEPLTDEEYEDRRRAVIDGCKYIAEQYHAATFDKSSYTEQVAHLREIGCISDPHESIRMYEYESNRFGYECKQYHADCMEYVGWGEDLIANYMSGGAGCCIVEEKYLSHDNDDSLYAYLRNITGDKSYTESSVRSKAQDVFSEEWRLNVANDRWVVGP